MYFKKLEIIGFKSFADKTAVEFQTGVTAIVGPNGCGKSNISDAIRWVLGEQSAKSLRGSSMEDVIFNGSADKEPLNFAEVSLTLSNETKFLPVDYDEVTISRRLYRSGESEYLLNKNIVRLKDIQEMLFGTGIGTESYSVIEQGKMDQVLNSKPDERRAIFEEAAGITKYKAKKKEALRKLEQTDSNLLRVNDIIQEVKRQISSVERQAKKAEQYKVEFEKMKTLELGVSSREFLLFDENRREKETEIETLRQEERSGLAAATEIETRLSVEREVWEKLENSLFESQSKEMGAQSEIRATQDRILLNRERMGELVERKAQVAVQVENIRRRLADLAGERAKLDEAAAQARAEENEGRVFLESAEKDFAGVEAAFAEQRAEEKGAAERLTETALERSRIQGELSRLQSEENAAASRLRRVKQDEDSLLREIQKIDERQRLPLFESQGTGAFAHFEAKIAEWKQKLLAFMREWAGRGEGVEKELEERIRQFAGEIGAIQGRMDHRDIEQRHLAEARQKAEGKLAAYADEIRESQAQMQQFDESRREKEVQLRKLEEEAVAAETALREVRERHSQKSRAREDYLVKLTETRSRHAHFVQRLEQAEKDRRWIAETEANQSELIQSLEKEAEESAGKRESLETENAALETELKKMGEQRDEIVRAAEGLRREKEAKAAELTALETERRGRQDFLQKARQSLHAFEMKSAEIRFEMDRLKERIFNAYQIDLAIREESAESEDAAREALYSLPEGMDVEAAKAEIQKYREKLNRMGPVNLVAIDEHQEMTERYQFLTQQEQDLLKAKDDLHKAIQKINRTTKELFAETFAKVQQNFSDYFRLLFGGGTAELVLLDESDILESGIDIVARPPGKKLQNISLLSGGEKALTAVALVFALFKVRPSPFCILDEIDAPLDESNVDRFCAVLKDFISASQFILITHNKRTMNLADAIYGITMAQTGVSRVVSVKFGGNKAAAKDQAEAVNAG